MTTLTPLDPKTVSERMKQGAIALIDIREADEYAREHIEGSIPLPLSALDKGQLTLETGQKAVFHCRSGTRTETNCARLSAHVDGEAFVLQGGLNAWKAAGLPTAMDASAPLELARQTQIASGLLILTGTILGFAVHPGFWALAGFTGAGLFFAGVSGWCGMARLLGAMPWNRKAVA